MFDITLFDILKWWNRDITRPTLCIYTNQQTNQVKHIILKWYYLIFSKQVRLQEIPSRWIYKNSSKNRAKLSPLLDIFSSAIMNDLFMTFTSRLKVDAKCVYKQWNWITVANYFGTPPADWVHGYLYFEPGAWIWIKGFRRHFHIVKNWSGKFSLNSSRVRALGWPLLGIFSGFLWFFFRGVCGANHL